MSIREYCKVQGIHENTYFYWQKKLRKAACEEIANSNQPAVITGKAMIPRGWTSCEIAGNHPAKTTDEPKALSIEIGKCRVNIGDTVNEVLLSSVCRTLINLC
jgi:hypothetical protein